MSFEQKYTSQHFLELLSEDVPRSTAAVITEIGCSRKTAKRYLAELEEAGKIKKARIEGLIYYGWLRIPEKKPEKEFEKELEKEPLPSRKLKAESEDGIHFWCCIDEFREEHPQNQLAQLVCTLIRDADPDLYENRIIDVKKVDEDLSRLREWLLK